MGKEPELYCICRKPNADGFMIQCDRCDVWFHVNCIGISRTDAKNIENYYCEACIGKDSSLKVTYKPGYVTKSEAAKLPKIPKNDPNKIKQIVDKKSVAASQQPQLRQTQQQSSWDELPSNLQKTTLTKRQKPGPKGKSKSQHRRRQCNNPECRYESRFDSTYCSDECGMEFNRKRYEKFFKPKIVLRENSAGKNERIRIWNQLEDEKKSVIEKINQLKLARDELKETIRIIKYESKQQYNAKNPKDIEVDQDQDQDMVAEENEDSISGDATKTYCITCGCTIHINQALKHWSSCHRKNEGQWTFSAETIMDYNNDVTEDKEPQLRCNTPVEYKKKKGYCMNMRSACPFHCSWNPTKDEVCGCPMNVMQKLIADGHYCTELKKDCVRHYHWDRFRIATIDTERLHLFTKLDAINDRLKTAVDATDDCFGGVIGMMWHDTLLHKNDSEVKVD